MIFSETKLRRAYIIDPERIEDERGFFARSWCQREFTEHGLNSNLVQCNISYNKMRGTLRGMHYQSSPHAEAKLIRCTMGNIFDVIIDLRRDSETFMQWIDVELTAENRRMLYVPEGFAHGFSTLSDSSEVSYQMSAIYAPEASRGVRWNDPLFNITWPEQPRVISARDREYADFDPRSEV